MTGLSIRWVAQLLLGLLCTLPFIDARAASLLATPAKGAAGASIRLQTEDLTANTTYRLEFVGSPATTIGDYRTDARGNLSISLLLPSLPVGSGKLRLKTIGLGSSVVAYTTFTVLSGLTFTPLTNSPAAGQSFRFSVTGLSAGTLTVLYEDAAVLGPVTVSGGSFDSKFLLPTNRPAVLPGPARIKLLNRVGRVVTNQLSTTIQVLARPSNPFTIAITTPPPTAVKPSKPISTAGRLDVVANEPVPTSASLWFQGTDGRVFPLAAARVQRVNNEWRYTMAGGSPGLGAMTAGQAGNGSVLLTSEGQTSHGLSFLNTTSANSLNLLPEDVWRVVVRLRKPNGDPIAGAVVQMEGATPIDPNEPSTTFHSLYELLAQNTFPNQIAQAITLTDSFGCPVTLSRKLSTSTGRAEFQFSAEDLFIATLPMFNCGSTGCHQLGQRGLQLGINASAQGHGFQFPPGDPNEYDFLPHRYNVQYTGVDTDDTTDDLTSVVDWYQNVEVLNGGRDITFPLTLPPIIPKVVLYDVAAKPWLAKQYKSAVVNNGETIIDTNHVFGPVLSQVGLTPSWISTVSGQDYPTELTVRTDPAISGNVSSAKLYLDLDRNNTYEYVRNFTTNGAPLDCTINGLDTSLTWRAQLPNVKQRTGGRINGYAEFIGAPNSGQVTQKIAIDMVQPNLSWLNGSRISDQALQFSRGGQAVRITANESNGQAAVQLPSEPPYQIGRLRNETSNMRMLDLILGADGSQLLFSAVDGTHKEAGRNGSPTSFEPPIGLDFHEHETLIDQSFPLFYYVWGVPLLAGVEVGANFNILAEIDISGKATTSASGQPHLKLKTEPSLDMGLNFYLDIDVLFDLVDGGVDLDAVFALNMPIVVDPTQNPNVSVSECFTAFLNFSWHFEVFCLPLDFICDALNDIEGSEVLLSEQTGSGCSGNSPMPKQLFAALPSGKRAPSGRPSSRIEPRHAVVAYSRPGYGWMAFTQPDVSQQNPPRLVVRPTDGGDFSRTIDDVVISTAPGIRSVDLVYFQDNRAALVWAESAGTYATLATLGPIQRLARQRIMYSIWNGTEWTPKTALTNPSGGEGGVDLAACPAQEPNCPSDGEVYLVWTRDMAGDLTQHRTQIYQSRLIPSRGLSFTTPQPIDANALLDSSPSAGFVNGERVVAFVRSTSGVFSDTAARRVAYRFPGLGGVQVVAASPGSVAWPSILEDGNGGFVIAHTYSDDPSMFVGNRQRVAMLRGQTCTAGACTVTAQAITDADQRAIYGERPQLLRDGDGNFTVVMRGMGFGEDATGNNHRDFDPIGMSLHTGDLISFATRPNSAIVTPIPLTADGAGHFAPQAAFDPELGQIVVLSTRGLEINPATRAKFQDATGSLVQARAVAGTVDSDLSVHAINAEPDLRVETVSANVSALRAGSAFQATATVRNIGAAFVNVPIAAQTLVFSWDAPLDEGGTLIGSRNIPNMASAQVNSFTISGTVPSGFKPEQKHRLYAKLLIGNNPFTDADTSNNEAYHEFGGMPMVFGVNTNAYPGTSLVQLTWEAPTDPDNVVEGYRVWCHDGDGQWRHLGSSFELGFLDLGAPIGVQRHYRVSTYSKNMIESPGSMEAVATASLNELAFKNGFE